MVSCSVTVRYITDNYSVYSVHDTQEKHISRDTEGCTDCLQHKCHI